MTPRLAALAPALVLAFPWGAAAQPEVVSAAPAGFEVRSVRIVKATPEQIWAMLGRIGSWWDSAHTYSGSAANMSLDLAPGGCFCERIPVGAQAAGGGRSQAPGGVQHGRVLMTMPYANVTLDAALGPILNEAAVGRLTWRLRTVDGGTEITQAYAVAGTIRAGAETLAPAVDMVMGQALERLAKALAA